MVEAKGNRYLYDGHNRRVKQEDGNGTSYSLYSQSGVLLYREKDAFAGEGTSYIYLGKKLIAKYGDVTPPTANNDRQYHRPFGETINPPKDDVGYTGHKFDTDLNLSYMQARYYDPIIGRFYSNDPVGALGHSNIAHGFNRYAYANNNPYKYTDPTGEIPLVAVAIWVLKEVGGEVFEQTTGIPAPTTKNIAKYGMKKAMQQSVKNRKKIEGVYKFKEGDQEYIGQSKDVMKRIKQHASNKDKFSKDEAGTLETKEVKGGKLEREKVEQGMINDATGGRGAASDKVSNKVNPCRREECS
ncbi:RHS repeat-associated core domain-containing protein [Pseudoalteromonas luteoviolacea]|uniref:RHS repeat-associated core domain-containing protein n=1 Tax=Pseudoalteromonas luteoviolacea TaxID=43657 RepID=UPI003D7ED034